VKYDLSGVVLSWLALRCEGRTLAAFSNFVTNTLHLSLFATRKVTIFPRHDATRMEEVEHDKSK
jgi:hypothetical protein